MKVDPPVWYLNAPCPCGGEYGPNFYTCATCGLVILLCGELGDVYSISNRRCGPWIGSIYTGEVAGNCYEDTHSAFRRSSSEEVRALGFRYPEDYA